MAIRHDEPWVQIAELDDQDQIRFTAEYQDLMGELDWAAKAFAAHLITLWYDPFEHTLDYGSGEAVCTEDQPGKFFRGGLDVVQDVVEYWATLWAHTDPFEDRDAAPHEVGLGAGLGPTWYRDVLRAKLVSIRLPKRLLVEYRDRTLEDMARRDEELEARGLLVRCERDSMLSLSEQLAEARARASERRAEYERRIREKVEVDNVVGRIDAAFEEVGVTLDDVLRAFPAARERIFRRLYPNLPVPERSEVDPKGSGDGA